MNQGLKILVFILIFFNFILLGFLIKDFKTGQVIQDNYEYANITRIIDGDTIETSQGKVRLLGINTPEKKEYYYGEAKNYLEQYVGKEVKLIYFNEDKDKYGRKLRYVFYNEFLNEMILTKGYAHYYSYQEDKYSKILINAENKAINNEMGIWEKSKDACSKCIILNELNNKDPGEYIILENKCYFSCNLSGWIIKDDASNKRLLNFILYEKEKIKIDFSGRVWNDAGDSFYLRDSEGKLVIFYRY